MSYGSRWSSARRAREPRAEGRGSIGRHKWQGAYGWTGRRRSAGVS